MDKFNRKVQDIEIAAYSKVTAVDNRIKEALIDFADDTSGSDTTEKIGMVVVAVVIVGLLATVMRELMPNLFQTMINKAKTQLSAIF
jgi:hypothetical protein